jgi:phosphinothricin acetyltransferase
LTIRPATEADARGKHSRVAAVSSALSEGRAFRAAPGFEEVAVLPEAGWKSGRRRDLHPMQKRL